MPKLMRNRWLRWTLVLGVLIALGCGIYQVQEPAPMCVIPYANELVPVAFLGDGAQLITRPRLTEEVLDIEVGRLPRKTTLAFMRGPVEVWETNSGDFPKSFIETYDSLYPYVFSNNGQFLAAQVNEIRIDNGKKTILSKSLLIVDFKSGKTTTTALSGTGLESKLSFSPGDGYVAHFSAPENALAIYDPATGNLIGKRESRGFVYPLSRSSEKVLHYMSLAKGQTHVEVWNAKTNASVAMLENIHAHGNQGEADGFLLIPKSRRGQEKLAEWVLWNRDTHQTEAEFETDDRDIVRLSEKPLRLAVQKFDGIDQTVQVRDLPQGRVVGESLPAKIQSFGFSPNGKYLAVITGDFDQHSVKTTMFDSASMKTLWQLHVHRGDRIFSADSDFMFVQAENQRAVLAINCQTGEVRTSIELTEANVSNKSPVQLKPSRDKQCLLVFRRHGNEIGNSVTRWKTWFNWLPWMGSSPRADNDLTVVFSVDTLTERFRLEDSGVFNAMLSNDGQMLVTHHDESAGSVIRCWDVDAQKPLHWPIGVPATLAALVVLFAWWRSRRLIARKAAGG